MKKRIRSKKLISSLAISTLVLGLFVTTVINADETDVITEPEIQEVEEITEEEIIEEEQEVVEEEIVEESEEVVSSEASTITETEQVDRSSLARVDLTANAFPESSKPLHDAIIAKYGNLIDTDGNKIISIVEANTYSGQIHLYNEGITGTLHGIENFTNTTHVLLYGNQLSGTLPENIGDMKSLVGLYLKNNRLSGVIPNSIGELNNLSVLHLGSNQLSGTIPDSIGNLKNLTVLELSINQLSGEIPSSIGNLVNLDSLVIYMNQFTGIIPSSIKNLANLKTLSYAYNDIETADLSGLNKLEILSISGTATNANMTNVYNFFITKGKALTEQAVRLVDTDSFSTWDSASSYYVIESGKNVTYTITYGVVTDSYLQMIVSDQIKLSQGGLMDNAGNLIIGADLSNVVDGSIVLPKGGIVVTGDATYTFDGNTIISETGITTEGNIITEKHMTDGSSVDLVGVITETNNSEGNTITIDLSDSRGITALKPGTIITNNDGDKVYISDEATMDNEGNITSSGTYVTVASDKTATTNSDGTITLPENSTVTVNGEDTTYPGTIIFSPEDGSLKYIPVSELLNEDGTDLGKGITQKDIDDARTLVDGLTEGALQDQLTDIIDTAQNILNAKDAVEDLFTDGTHTSIPDSLTLTDINDAQDLVNKIPDGTLKEELQKEIDKAKDMLNAKDKVDGLFADEAHTDIIDGLTQGNIDDAQKAVDKLPNGDLKEELQKEIDKAQDMLDAKDKVDNLFNDKKDNLVDGVTQKDIDKAQDAVDKLPDGTLKDELQKEIDKAQDMLNAKDAVGDLLDKDGNLNSGITQEDIDKAQDLVNKLSDGELKDELQTIIDNAQKQLDEKNKNNPSTAPTVQKPSVDSGSTSSTSNVKTGDTTNVSLYLGLLAISLGGVVLVKRRKTESN